MSKKIITPEILEQIKTKLFKVPRAKIPKTWLENENQILDAVLTKLYSGENFVNTAKSVKVSDSTIQKFYKNFEAILSENGIESIPSGTQKAYKIKTF